jgi:hypothetical protein
VRVRAVLLVVVAFFLGALAAGGIGVRVIREVRATEDATSLPDANVASTTVPTVPPAPVYLVDPNETIIASTALVPTSMELGDGQLAIGYDLVTRAPHLGVEPAAVVGNFGRVTVVDPADLDHLHPSRWILDTAGGRVEGGPASPSVRVARFEVPDGLSLGDVEGATIVEALVPVAIDVTFALSRSEPVVEVLPGVTIELLNVAEQSTTSIVQVGIEATSGAHLSIEGFGPGWRSAFFEAEGRPRVNLTWMSGAVPDEIPLRAAGTVWVPLDGSFPVSLEGLR